MGAPLSAQAPPVRPYFTEVPAAASGLTWTHDNAVSVTRFLPESLGPGCAFLDYDNDGWMDIYLVNTGPSDFYTPRRPARNALYRNNRDGTFTDVTLQAGVAGGTFGTGVAVGDYDNDGLPDLFVTAYGRCLLYHNNGDGTFTDVTERAGVAAPGFTTSALWFDYDGDGLLDLFVASYVDYSPNAPRLCADRRGDVLAYHYCIPHLFKPTASLLFRNNGDGTFRRADRGTVIAASAAKALGVVATDVDNDGRLDLFMASDTSANRLFVNRAGGWLEQAVRQGVAYGETGRARSGMGVDAADVDGDGWQDLVVGNIDHEMHALYRNGRGDFFTDVARDHGLSQATRLMSGWGLKFFDVDNDGRVDLFIGNGHPDDTISQRAPEVQYRQPPLLFMHDGRRLRDVSAEAGPVFQRPLSVRGPGRRRHEQRRPSRRAARHQRRPAGAAAEHGGGPPLGGCAPAGRPRQPRRRRRAHFLVRGRYPALAAQDRWRQLSLVARPARGAGYRHGNVDRLGRGQMAATEPARRSASRMSP